MKARYLFAAAAAAIAIGSTANATVYYHDIGPIVAPDSYGDSFKVTPGAVDALYTFTLSQTLVMTAGSFTSSPPPIIFDASGKTGIYAGTYTAATPPPGTKLSLAAANTTANGSNSTAIPMTTLVAGSYTYYVAGTATANTRLSSSISFELPAVPEPATWGLMVLGFGAVGAGLRSSRRKVIFA